MEPVLRESVTLGGVSDEFEGDTSADTTTILHARHVPDTAPGASFHLEVLEGAERGTCFDLDGTEPGARLLGQSEACDFRLADREVSRRHATLDVEGSRLRITDLGSTNGTFVNSVAVVEAFLSGGETLRVGSTVIGVERRAAVTRSTRVERSGFGSFVGNSPELLRLYPLIERLAASEVSLVIEGETGTGKEVLAESIHEHSPRRAGPYVVLDCTTIAPSLAEAELFGYERGAFTGASGQRKGVFELAHKGTLLIDEIGDLDTALQPKLLRALERGEIRRIGGAQPIKVDVRVIAATRRDLDQAVVEGTFRDDLFHRLVVGRIALPPLRRRRGDIEVLARHFWRELGSDAPLPARLLERWEAYSWPGNVRELRNAIARQLALGGHDEQEAVPPDSPASSSEAAPVSHDVIAQVLAASLPFPVARLRVLDLFQRLYVEAALRTHGGNAERAAAASGIGRRYFQMLKSGRRKR
jgi:DNA-binding NtrC family response regulator